MTDNDRLLQEVIGRDDGAFKKLCLETGPDIRRHLGERIPPKWQHLIDDAMQEAHMIMWEQLPGFDFRGYQAFRGWLHRVARNVFHNMLAAEFAQRRDARQRIGFDQVGIALPAPGKTPSSWAARREQCSIVTRTIAKMPEDLASILYWKLIEGWTLAEIGCFLNYTHGTLSRRYRSALVMLKRLLPPGIRF